jgi:general stress protein YciG
MPWSEESKRSARRKRIENAGGEEAFKKQMREMGSTGGKKSNHSWLKGNSKKAKEVGSKGGKISRPGKIYIGTDENGKPMYINKV